MLPQLCNLCLPSFYPEVKGGGKAQTPHLLPLSFPFSSKISHFSTIFHSLHSSSCCCTLRSGGEKSSQEASEKLRDGNKANSVLPLSEKDLKKVVQKTAKTFAPRASTATKNQAVPDGALYTVFEVQGYATMLFDGALLFNLMFPSNEPDIWRLMGMWSIWMFTIPSLRARDCSKNEKEALNYLFLLIPLLNVLIPFFWKSFAVIWSADNMALILLYAWKFDWLEKFKGKEV